MRNFVVPAVLVAAMAPGCVYDDSGLEAPDGAPLLHRLVPRAVLTLEDSSEIAITATGADGQRLSGMEAHVSEGRAAIRATPEGVVVVEGLDVKLADVTVPAGVLSPASYQLTDLRLRLGIQLATVPEWSADGRHAVGTGQADVLLDWALALDGDVVPMATRKLEGSPFQIAVDLDDANNVTARISTSVDGELSRLLDRIMLSDFSMALDATTKPSVD